MLAIIVFINVFWLFIIAAVAAFAGYSFRSSQIAKNKKRVLSLENEMLNNHEEILKLQQELAKIEKTSNPPYKIRVVPMNELNSQQDTERVMNDE